MDFKDRNKKVADQVQIKGKNGTYPVFGGDEPVKVTVVLSDAGSAAAGECGNTVFVLADCNFNGSGSALKCK